MAAQQVDIYPSLFQQELEFSAVQEQLRPYCATEEAKALIGELRPEADWPTLSIELKRTDELLQLLERGETAPSVATGSMKKILHLLEIQNVVLDEKQIQQVRGLAETYENAFRYFFQRREICPRIYGEFAAHQPEPLIVKEIDQIIDERAEVRSNASKTLATIRRELATQRKQADRLFYKVARSLEAENMLADFRETVKENRRVLAILPTYKNRIKGIFHGSSAKQSVMFVEPAATIEINNSIAQLIDDERREIRKILQVLCRFLQGYLTPLRQFDTQLIAMDLLRAKAQWAVDSEALIPNIDPNNQHITCKDGYHPILRAHNRKLGKSTVPLNLELSPEKRLVVISGPNAGGKSIALKTIGLLSYMLQCGIPIPVHPESSWCVFLRIMGDIGDHQSIENELSTYSSRLKKMTRFLAEANEKTLLLIDEFGSGSDPDLGSSLAAVCLRKLHDAHCTGIVTTHFNNIKALAAELPGTVNAAMAFHRSTFRPLYTLNLGSPGSSYTFEVAESVGISPELIVLAKRGVNESVASINHLLVELQDEKQALQSATENLQSRVQQMQDNQRKQNVTIKKLEEKVEKQRRINQDMSDVLIWGKRFKQLSDAWIKNPTPENKRSIGGRFWKMMKERSSKSEAMEEEKDSAEKSKENKRLQRLLKMPIEVGDKVKIFESNLEGVVEEIKKDKYKVKMGLMSSTVQRSQIIPVVKRKKPNSQDGNSKKSESKKNKS
ncbi:MAG: hypothetical protein JJU02_13750 [Cryomorphaceae bacterium]|nr:hypothetical protein [Cryomorphaceae bacterium]